MHATALGICQENAGNDVGAWLDPLTGNITPRRPKPSWQEEAQNYSFIPNKPPATQLGVPSVAKCIREKNCAPGSIAVTDN